MDAPAAGHGGAARPQPADRAVRQHDPVFEMVGAALVDALCDLREDAVAMLDKLVRIYKNEE